MTSAPGTSSRASVDRQLERLLVDGVGFRDRDDAVLDTEQAKDRQVLERLRPRTLLASITSRNRSMPVAPAIIVRTKRSWPGTSTSDRRRPSGSSSGA